MENEELTIVSAPGYVGKTTFDPSTKKPIDRQVKVDERYITTEIGPITLGPGEVLDVIDEKEKGELMYIKVISDNPYANVYLEVDDYRNSTTGETHAELLYDQRQTNVEGQFFIESDGTNGKGYPVVWNPQTNPTAYRKGIKMRVSNPLRPNKNALGFDLALTGRAGLPTPIQPLHMAGGSFTHAGLAGASLELLSDAIANPVGTNGGYAVDSVMNQSVFNSIGATLAEGNLYAGRAGKPVFRKASETIHYPSARGPQNYNGVELLPAETRPASPLGPINISVSAATNFPGTVDTPSTSTITFTGDNAALNNYVSPTAGTQLPSGNGFKKGDRVFIRNGDTIHFLGEATDVQFTKNTDNEITNFDTYKVIVKPGVKNALSITFNPDDDYASDSFCYGTVATHADISPEIVIKKVILRRKRLVTYEG